MSGVPVVRVHPDAATLAAATAARLITRLIDVQAGRDADEPVHLVLTGGGTGIAVLAQVAASPACAAVDWSRVHVWWGDERFLPDGHPDRNATQADDALLRHLPVPAEQVHRMPPSDDPVTGDDVDAAAAAYAATLAEHAVEGASSPAFDVLLLGMGPDGHVASLFPGHPGLEVTDVAALAVRDSPKPPPTRISLSTTAIRGAGEVWIVVAGADKAAMAEQGVIGNPAVPAGRARGTRGTLWLLDHAAATG